MKIKLFLLALILPIIFVSCKDDDSDPITPANKTYMPLKANNYWIYDTYTLNMDNSIQAESKEKDSLVTISSQTFLERDAYLVKQYTDNELSADRYFDYESNKFYVESNYLLPFSSSSTSSFALPLDKITNQWVVLADFNATSSWTILTHQFANEPITFPGLPAGIKFNANYTVKGTKGGTSAITVGSASLQATEFTIEHKISGTLNYSIISAPLEFTIVQKFYFAENIGIVKSLTESKTVSFTITGLGNQSFDINGHQKNLIRYNVVQ